MDRPSKARRRNAIAIRPVLAGLVWVAVLALPLNVRAADPILQPGIVEEIPAPWNDRWELFSWAEAPSKLRASASFSGIWNDNVLITENSPIEDFLWDTNLALWFESSAAEDLLRNYLAFGYDPQILTYSDLDVLDAENHRWFANYKYSGARFTAGIDHRYAEFSDVSRVSGSGLNPTDVLAGVDDVGAGVDNALLDLTDAERDLGRRIAGSREVTSLFALVELSDAGIFRPAGNRRFQKINDLAGSEDFQEWWVEGVFFRKSSRKLRLGLGPRYGLAEFSEAHDQTYLQGLAHLRYRHSPKMQVDGLAGVDGREYGTDSENQTTPLFSARMAWAPSDRTAVSIEGFQRARAAFRGDAATDLGARLVVNQNLFRRFDYSLRCGYINSDFEDGGLTGTRGQREDDFIFIRNALEYGLGEIAAFSVFHEFRDSDPSQNPGYNQSLTGLALGFEF